MAPSDIAVSKAVWPRASRACLRAPDQALNVLSNQPYRHYTILSKNQRSRKASAQSQQCGLPQHRPVGAMQTLDSLPTWMLNDPANAAVTEQHD